MRMLCLLPALLIPCGLPAQEGYVGLLGGRTAVELTSEANDFGSVVGAFFQVDLSLYKNFPFADRFNVQLRLEVFNIFNTVNLIADGINNTYDVPVTLDAPRDQATVVVGEDRAALPGNFGQATSVRDARQFQLGVKFSF